MEEIIMMFYLQGLTMGLAYVAPIGLQNLFVINTALTQKKSRVFLTALIVVFFDVSLALACFFGIGAIMQSSNWLQMAILLIGSAIVIWIGVTLLRAHDTMDTSTNVNVPIVKVISTACVVTWFNPQALIDGSMMLGAFRATLPDDQAVTFILGTATASVCWFFGISALLSLFSARFTDKTLRVINVVCGIVIIFYGCKLFYNFMQMALPLIK
jgi:Lysine efflux permease